MSEKKDMDPILDDLFAQAREARPVPDMDLMARILGDAAEASPLLPPAPVPPVKPRWRDWISDLVPGGATALASLTTCALAGIFIGYAGLGDLPLMAGADFLGDSAIPTFDASVLDDEISYLTTEDGA